MSKINTDLSFLMHFNDFTEEMEKTTIKLNPAENNLYIDKSISYFGTSSLCFPEDSESYISISTHDVSIKDNNNFTIEFWAYFPTNDHRGLIETALNNEYFGWALYLLLLDGKMYPRLTCFGKNGEPTTYISSSKVIEINTWYHFAFIHSDNYIYLYVNGTRLGRSSRWADYDFSSGYSIYDDITTTNINLNIGKSSADNTFFKDIYFNGHIDEFGITTYDKYTTTSIKIPTHVLDMLDIEKQQYLKRNIHKNFIYNTNTKYYIIKNIKNQQDLKRNIYKTINKYNFIYRNVLKDIEYDNILIRYIIKDFKQKQYLKRNIYKNFIYNLNTKYNYNKDYTYIYNTIRNIIANNTSIILLQRNIIKSIIYNINTIRIILKHVNQINILQRNIIKDYNIIYNAIRNIIINNTLNILSQRNIIKSIINKFNIKYNYNKTYNYNINTIKIITVINILSNTTLRNIIKNNSIKINTIRIIRKSYKSFIKRNIIKNINISLNTIFITHTNINLVNIITRITNINKDIYINLQRNIIKNYIYKFNTRYNYNAKYNYNNIIIRNIYKNSHINISLIRYINYNTTNISYLKRNIQKNYKYTFNLIILNVFSEITNNITKRIINLSYNIEFDLERYIQSVRINKHFIQKITAKNFIFKFNIIRNSVNIRRRYERFDTKRIIRKEKGKANIVTMYMIPSGIYN